MSLQSYAERPAVAGLSIVAVGIVAGVIGAIAVIYLRPILIIMVFAGALLLAPLLVIRDRKAYWLFVLILSILLDISKRMTTWLADPIALKQELGLPASGTLSLDIYPTDIVLFGMIAFWLVRVSLKRETFYFPKVGYIFLLYLVWTLIGALIEARSFSLSIFEWCRQVLYFFSFVYIANNVVTKAQFRAVALALFVGMTIAAGSVITFFDLNWGTETNAFAVFYNDRSQSDQTLYGGYGERSVKRSAGIFPHPSHAGYYMEYTLPLVLIFLIAAQRWRERLLYAALFALGWVGMYFTFARSPVIGLVFGCIVVIGVAGWSQLISRRAFARCILAFAIVVGLATPIAIGYMNTRLETISRREELIQMALDTVSQRPVMGAGLNNSSVVSPARRMDRSRSGARELNVTVVHNYYLVSLVEVGIVGALLLFGFFGRIYLQAFSHVRMVSDPERKLLLVGIIGSFSSIAVHNFGDPFGGHMVWSMLWLYAGLVCGIARQIDVTAAASSLGRRRPIAAIPAAP